MIADILGRPLRNLRLSVTDRCNLRCEYCMPEDDYIWLPREDVLHFEETSALVDLFITFGVDRIRLTGGEPLLRRDLPAFVAMNYAFREIRQAHIDGGRSVIRGCGCLFAGIGHLFLNGRRGR